MPRLNITINVTHKYKGKVSVFSMGSVNSKKGKTTNTIKKQKNKNIDNHFKRKKHSNSTNKSHYSQTLIRNKNKELKKLDFKPKTRKHLIVDDARYNREILSKYLDKIGVASKEASNGTDALKYIEEIKDFDIIWMDLRMPIMGGFDCTKILREKGYTGVIIGVTGDVSKENIIQCYDVGMNHVMFKPIIFSEFINMFYIKKYIDDKQ
jgi:CheY-like chemotaxis protein